MGVASLVVGIFAVIGAGICTAPCFGWFAFLGVPIAVAGMGLGIGELFQTIRGHYKGEDEFPNLRHGVTGFLLCTVSLAWSLFMIVTKGGVL